MARSILRMGGAVMLLLAMTFSMASCQPGNAPANGIATSTSPTTQTGQLDRALARQKWLAWKPISAPMPHHYSDDEARDLVRQDAENHRPDGAQGKPIPEVVRFSDGDGTDVAQCMTEAGFPTEASGLNYSFTSENVTTAQRQLSDIAFWECTAKYPRPIEWLAPYDEGTYERMYEYFVTFYVPCMKDLGVEIPTANIPTQEAWVAQHMSADQSADTWYPPAIAASLLSSTKVPEGLTEDTMEWYCPAFPPSLAN